MVRPVDVRCADPADEKRHAGVNVKCTPTEKRALEQRAKAAGMSLSHYLRTIAQAGEMPAGQGDAAPKKQAAQQWEVYHVDDLGHDPLGGDQRALVR